MKRLSTIIAETTTPQLGAPHIACHLTPVGNIITTLKAFTARLGITIQPYEDCGILIQSTRFNTKEGLANILCKSYFDDRAVNPLSVDTYVHQCGLEMYVRPVSQSQVDVIAYPNDNGNEVPGITLYDYLYKA